MKLTQVQHLTLKQTRHETNFQDFPKFIHVITPVDWNIHAFVMHVVHSIHHIIAIHTQKSLLLVYLFTTGGEAFIRILTIFLK